MKTAALIAGTVAVTAVLTVVTIVYGVPALKAHDAALSAMGPGMASTAPAARQSIAPGGPPRYGAMQTRPARIPSAAIPCGHCGIVQSVRRIRVTARPSGGGAILGGIAGAVLGHQLGRGGGRDLATVAGAAGGALFGNHIEETENAHYLYEVTVLRNSGGVTVLRQTTYIAPGRQVRIEGGRAVIR
ncbi:MAG: glycine zipper 2TM domain-containing protein [Acidiferrobacteraceae bacterium]